METLRQAPEWGTPETREIIARQSEEFKRAGIYDSYAESLKRILRINKEIDEAFKDRGYRRFDPLPLERTLQLDMPLLAAGINSDGLLARHGVIAHLGIAKVNPETGSISKGSFLWPIADVYDESFRIVEPSFKEAQMSLILQKAEELRQARLYLAE
jgi:hypothetical protein